MHVKHMEVQGQPGSERQERAEKTDRIGAAGNSDQNSFAATEHPVTAKLCWSESPAAPILSVFSAHSWRLPPRWL